MNHSLLEGERLHGDIADIAQHYEEAEREAGIYAATHRPIEHPIIMDGDRICLNCFDPIGRARLRAAPTAVRCLDCQQAHEHRQTRRLAA